MPKRENNNCGFGLLAFIGVLAVISILSMALFTGMLTDIVSSARLARNIQAWQLCEAGIELALYKLNFAEEPVEEISEQELGLGAFRVKLQRTAKEEIKLIINAQIPATKPWLMRSAEALLIKKDGKYQVLKKAFF